MIRDYSNDVYQRLMSEIDVIRTETINPVTDFMGDIAYHIGKFAHIIELKDNMKNVTDYQKAILDMDDITKEKLKKIFQTVEHLDNIYAKEIKMITERQYSYRDKLKVLTEQIKPGLHITEAKELKRICSQFNRKLEQYDKEINKVFEAELKKEEKRLLSDGTKKLGGSAIGTVVNIMSMPFKWTKALYVHGLSGLAGEAISDTWSLINSVFDFSTALGGMAGVGLISGLKKVKWANSVGREKGMQRMDKLIHGEGLSGGLEADDVPEGVVKLSKKIDNIVDEIDTYNTLFDFKKSKVITDKEKQFEKIKKWANFKKEAEVASKIKKIYSTASSGVYDLFEENGPEKTIAGALDDEFKIKKKIDLLAPISNLLKK